MHQNSGKIQRESRNSMKRFFFPFNEGVRDCKKTFFLAWTFASRKWLRIVLFARGMRLHNAREDSCDWSATTFLRDASRCIDSIKGRMKSYRVSGTRFCKQSSIAEVSGPGEMSRREGFCNGRDTLFGFFDSCPRIVLRKIEVNETRRDIATDESSRWNGHVTAHFRTFAMEPWPPFWSQLIGDEKCRKMVDFYLQIVLGILVKKRENNISNDRANNEYFDDS